MKCHVSWLWVASFLISAAGRHLRAAARRRRRDSAGRTQLQAVPAHYLHSSGNLHLYDRQARIPSGDVGAARCRPRSKALRRGFFVAHPLCRRFPPALDGSNEAGRQWCERVSHLEIDMLCPQHGAILSGRRRPALHQLVRRVARRRPAQLNPDVLPATTGHIAPLRGACRLFDIRQCSRQAPPENGLTPLKAKRNDLHPRFSD